MEIKSTDLKADEAIQMVGALLTADEVSDFIGGEKRKTVIDAAEERLKALVILPGAASSAPTKQGEQAGPITQSTSDFKAGVQRTKSYVTCEDVLERMRSEGNGK
jgi:hypothetical protein